MLQYISQLLAGSRNGPGRSPGAARVNDPRDQTRRRRIPSRLTTPREAPSKRTRWWQHKRELERGDKFATCSPNSPCGEVRRRRALAKATLGWGKDVQARSESPHPTRFARRPPHQGEAWSKWQILGTTNRHSISTAQRHDREAAVSVPGIAAAVLALAIGVEAIPPFDRLQQSGRPQFAHQPVALGVDIRTDMMGDLPRGVAEAHFVIEGCGAVLTPPDPISQIALAIPTILLYELSIFAVALAEKSHAASAGTAKSSRKPA